jgi:hypothetical protein
MFYDDHSTDGPHDPKASPLYGAASGYEIPSHAPTDVHDIGDMPAGTVPAESTATVCYCGHLPEPHGVGREFHGSVYVPTPEGSAQAAYDRFESGDNICH